MSDSIFQTTMMGLETGLQVRHIATFEKELQIPVRKGNSIIGVISKECTGPIKSCLRTLDEAMLIAAQEPLTQFIPLMAQPPSYRLVLQGGSIRGIVTRSDLLKLPVRLFAFTLVTHLEQLMTDVIRANYPDCQDETQWLTYLTGARQVKVNEKQQDLKQKNYDLPLLECTDFCDKRDIVRKLCSLSSRSKFKDDFEAIEKYLRNTVAHAGSYARNDKEMERFIQLIICTQRWIGELEILPYPPPDPRRLSR